MKLWKGSCCKTGCLSCTGHPCKLIKNISTCVAQSCLCMKHKNMYSKLRLLEIALLFPCNCLTQDDPASNVILEVIKTDSLRKLERGVRREAERSILTAAKLISPVVEDSYSAGTVTSCSLS
jgi:hypothetical protein